VVGHHRDFWLAALPHTPLGELTALPKVLLLYLRGPTSKEGKGKGGNGEWDGIEGEREGKGK